jgi:hypothetical protein
MKHKASQLNWGISRSILDLDSLQGYGCIKLSNSVMNVLLATTTLNVLGLAYIVLEGLFGKSKRISK